MIEPQQPKFFVPMNFLVLVRRIFPHLAWAADIGWCWLACSGRGQGLVLGVKLPLGIRVLGNRSYRNRYYPTATAYLKPLCGTAGL